MSKTSGEIVQVSDQQIEPVEVEVLPASKSNQPAPLTETVTAAATLALTRVALRALQALVRSVFPGSDTRIQTSPRETSRNVQQPASQRSAQQTRHRWRGGR
ncbi:MAG: hypothetical protein ACP5JG_15740 [Anaerolineae bacterium]